MRTLRHRRRLDVHRSSPADAAGFRERLCGDPSAWLPAPARYRGDGEWTIPVRGLSVTRDVACRVGPPWSRGAATWRALSFRPLDDAPGAAVPAPVLPSFRGEIGLVEGPSGSASLRLRGRYAPPGGHLGAVLDALALRHVAVGTADELLAAVAGRLDAAASRKG